MSFLAFLIDFIMLILILSDVSVIGSLANSRLADHRF